MRYLITFYACIWLPFMHVFGLLLLKYAWYGVSNLCITAVTSCNCLLCVS